MPAAQKLDVTIDKATKVNLGILITLLGSAVGGAFYLSDLNGNVVSMGEKLVAVENAIERNTATLNSDGKDIAVILSRLTALETRVTKLEGQ